MSSSRHPAIHSVATTLLGVSCKLVLRYKRYEPIPYMQHTVQYHLTGDNKIAPGPQVRGKSNRSFSDVNTTILG